MKKWMYFCLVLLVLLAGCSRQPEPDAEIPPFSGGSGTQTDPYRISTAEDLYQLADRINRKETRDAFAASHYVLTGDIVLEEGKPWTPIAEFRGVFDGAGHTIRAMRLEVSKKPTGGEAQLGFVGNLRGTVENLTFRDCTLSWAPEDSGEVGIVAGKVWDGVIRNCHVTGASSVSGTYHVGGICGNINDRSVLEGCSNAAAVTGNGTIVIAGGIVGRAACAVTDCTNSGAITSSGDGAGIVCTATGGVADCTNTGDVTAEGYAAGIVVSFTDGALNSRKNEPDVELKNCANSGTILSTGDPAGGIAASCRTGSVVDCVNSGSVTSPEEVGGIFAFFQPSMFGTPCAYFRVTGCTNTGAVTNSDHSFLYPVGGICGRIYDCPTDVFFENCENLGDLSSGTRAGGIVGDAQFRTLTLNRCVNSGAVHGAEFVGGLVGQISPMQTEQEETLLFEAKDCRNTGPVFAEKSLGYDGGVYIGGILGNINELTAPRPFTDVIFEGCENSGALTASQETRAVYSHDLCGSHAAN